MGVALVATCSALLGLAPVQAEPTLFPTSAPAALTETQRSGPLAVTAWQNGFVVVHTDGDLILVQPYDRGGRLAGEPIVVGDAAAGSVGGVAAAKTQAAGIVVAWTVVGDAGERTLLARRLLSAADDDDPIVIASEGVGSDSIAATGTSDTDFAVLWAAPGDAALRVRAMFADGLGATHTVERSRASLLGDIDIAAAGPDKVVVEWSYSYVEGFEDICFEVTGYATEYRLIDPSTGATESLGHEGGGLESRAGAFGIATARLGPERFVVAWTDGFYCCDCYPWGPFRPQWRVFDGVGAQQGPRVDLQSDDSQYEDEMGGLAADGRLGGGFVVAWANATEYGGPWRAQLLSADGDGIPDSAVIRVAPGTSEYQRIRSVAALEDDFMVVWRGIESGLQRRTFRRAPGPPCGDPDGNGSVHASDALRVLEAGTGARYCAPVACDVDGSGAVNASDALRTLRAAVGQPVELSCPLDED